jgi:nitroreductase
MGSTHRFIPYRPERLDPSEALRRGRAFAERMRGRRSVRMFAPDPVPRELIETAVGVACSAPSGANLQPWRFVAVSDPEIKQRIREGAEAEERLNYGGRMPERWLRDLEPLGTDADKSYLEVVPWILVVFRQSAREDGGRNYYVQESVGIATGFLFAALQEMGLATLPHTPSPMRFLNDILDRPENEKPHLLMPVGYPAPDCTVPDITKRPLTESLVVVDGRDR